MNNLRLSIKSNYPSFFKKFYFIKVIPILLILCISCEKSEPDNTSKLRGLAAIVNSTKTQSYVVTTFAGSTRGSVDGTGIAAKFLSPYGITIDSADTLYVSDAFDNKIRKITSSAVVTTLAGSGKQATVDGLGVAASFNYPFDLAVSANGEIYTVDYTNSNVRKITPEGLVSTFAGTGSSGAIDGIGTAASFYKPQGIAVDSSGIIYIADSLNNKIRKITSDGSVTTFAGSNSVSGSVDGIATAASFSTPVGITVDKKGNIYVADVYLSKIRKITSVGLVTTIAGSGTSGFNDGLAITASFRGPGGLTADDNGNIYVADTYNSRIRKINSEAVVTTIAGAGSEGFADGSGISAMFYYPQGIVLDSKGNIFIADSGNSRIRKITLQ